MRLAKKAKWIDMPFGWVTQEGPRNLYCMGVPIPEWEGAILGVCRKKINDIISTMTSSARLLQPAALFPTGWCHINFFPACHQNSLAFVCKSSVLIDSEELRKTGPVKR